jgi:hypothetical protein
MIVPIEVQSLTTNHKGETTMGVILGIVIAVAALVTLGWPVAALVFYIIKQTNSVKHMNAMARYQREQAEWHTEKIRLETEALRIKNNKAGGNTGLPLPPIIRP